MLQLEPKYGPVTRLQLPIAGDFYLVHNPQAVEELCVERTEAFPDRLSAPVFDNLNLNRGLVYESGERQRRQKRVCRPSFGKEACLESFLGAIQQESRALAARWTDRRAQANGRLTVDLYEEARRLTLDIVLRVTFGTRVERSDELSDVIGQFISQTVNVANEVPPWWAVGLSLPYRRVKVLLPKIREIITEIVAQRRVQLAAGEDIADGDLLGELLTQQEGRDMSDDDILYVLFDVIIAGSDTTASTIAAMIFCFYQEDEVFANVRAELERAGPLDDLTLDDVDEKLPYLQACVKETLRLYPPVPMVGRKCVATDELAGYLVPEGATMAWSPWFLGRDAKQWREPVDAFRPERWDMEDALWSTTPAGEVRHEFAWLPFGAGARGCLGRRLGVTEATVGAAYLLKLFDYRFERIEKPLKFTYDLTLNLQGRCMAQVEPKKAPAR